MYESTEVSWTVSTRRYVTEILNFNSFTRKVEQKYVVICFLVWPLFFYEKNNLYLKRSEERFVNIT